MNNLQIFQNNNFGEIRTVQINNEIWFVGKDVASALGYIKERNAIATHVDEEDKRVVPIQGDLGGTQEMTIINESGLYPLILSSKLPTAKEFKRWVTNEVLPSIRKTGSYIRPKTAMELIELEFQAIKEVKQEVEEVKKDLEDFKQDIPLLALEIECIIKARNKTAVSLLGGKESPAYKNKSLRGKVYSDLSREVKRQFGVDTYKAIKRSDCQKVISIIENYRLPICLYEEISKANGINIQLAI